MIVEIDLFETTLMVLLVWNLVLSVCLFVENQMRKLDHDLHDIKIKSIERRVR